MHESYGMSHVGQVRSNNEDSFAAEPQLQFFAVADGMGGAQAGERASQITIRTVVEDIEKVGREATIDDLADSVVRANRNVRGEAAQHPELAGMGTTIVAALIRPEKAYIVNVGDSRAYLRSGEDLYCVTTDHSWVNEIGRGLGLTEEQLRVHPYRNILTKAVGAEDEVAAQRVEVDFLPGDLLLLCSDGLHGVAGEQAVADALAADGNLKQKCEALIDASLQRGAPDNVTVVLVSGGTAGNGAGR